MNYIFISQSKEDTKRLGKLLSKNLQPGDILFLSGDLGAGKSEFVRGIALGLGINEPIPSPSFTILNVYNNGKIPLYHFDWYRIDNDEELYEIGTEDFLFSSGISCVEWPSMSNYYSESLNALKINIINDTNTEQRKIIIDDNRLDRNINLEELYNEYTCI